MPLGYSRPEGDLQRELEEVAQAATALGAALTTGLNSDLPPDFPKQQLLEICKSLTNLPNGTSMGCRGALDYARNRLPAIRRAHIYSQEFHNQAKDTEPSLRVTRDSAIDTRLRDLIASTTTALDEYRHTAAELSEDIEKPEAQISVDSELIQSGVKHSLVLEANLVGAQDTVERTTNPTSPKADDLKRQISDSQGLNRLARTELQMPRVAVSWYRHLLNALKEYPSLIRGSARGLKVGADVFEIAIDTWHDFHKNMMTATINEFRKACNALIRIADVLETTSYKTSSTESSSFNEQILDRKTDYESIVYYTREKFPGLTVSVEWTQALLKDISYERYPTIRDIDRVVNYAYPKVKIYADNNPDLFRYSTDWITKSLIFVDEEFRDAHDVSPGTRRAAIEAGLTR